MFLLVYKILWTKVMKLGKHPAVYTVAADIVRLKKAVNRGQ